MKKEYIAPLICVEALVEEGFIAATNGVTQTPGGGTTDGPSIGDPDDGEDYGSKDNSGFWEFED